MDVSVIIPCFNAADTIARQLEALARQNYAKRWEVIVSDNGSTDKSLEIVGQFSQRLPSLSVIDSSDRRGAAHARNVGARAARGHNLVFCDADDEVAPGWLSAMGEALCKHRFVACRLDFRKLNEKWVQEIFGSHAQLMGLQKAWFPPYLQHAGGGSLGVAKTVHEAVGGFDESLMAHEDTDYCFRIQLAGVDLHFEPAAVLHVRCRPMLTGCFLQAYRWSQHTVLLYKRYRPRGVCELWRWKSFASQCKNLLVSAACIHSRAEYALWICKVGWQLGRLRGSIRYHVPPV